MTALASDLRKAVLFSILLVLPFVVLEFVNVRPVRADAPGLIVLFLILFALPTGFLALGFSTARGFRAASGSGAAAGSGAASGTGATAGSLAAPRARLVVQLAGALFLFGLWGSVIADQLPCFLGMPNCD